MQVLETIDRAARAAESFADRLRHPYTSAVILAGGSGSRMGNTGSVTKQFMELCGMPVILRTILQFERCDLIDEIVLVVRKEELASYAPMLAGTGVRKVMSIVPGGETRQASAEAGLRAVNDKCRFIAIHDGARPLIRPEEISLVAREAYRIGAAAAASRAKDTVKLTDGNGYVESTPDRSTVWIAATPQIFKTEEYRASVYEGKKNAAAVTDDCSLVEAVGFPVRMVDIGYQNLKITTQEDLCFARAILAYRDGAGSAETDGAVRK